MGNCKITASIVTYHNLLGDLQNIIRCLLINELNITLYISDNSEDRNIENLCNDPRICYIYNNSNLGFGAAHNIAIKKAVQEGSNYHLILNPDIEFDPLIIRKMIQKMSENQLVGAIMPKVLNKDRSIQLLPKLLPSPFSILIRVIPPLKVIFRKKYSMYVLKSFQDVETNVPIISGCFSLFNIKVFSDIGYFDERFFMYFEDFDLSRRIHLKYITLYFPTVHITHAHERGAAKSLKLFTVFIKSAFLYFNKYGWIFDRARKQTNSIILKNLTNK